MCREVLELLRNNKQYKSNSYGRNEIISSCRCFSRKIYLVEEGIVKISHITQEGNKAISILLAKDQIFGSTAIFDHFYSNFISESISEKTIIFEFDIDNINKILNKNRSLYRGFLRILLEEFYELENRIKVLSMRSVERRVVNTLLDFIQKFKSPSPYSESIFITSPFNQNEFASYIRASRVAINNIIQKLKDKSLLDYERKNMVISQKIFSYAKSLENKV